MSKIFLTGCTHFGHANIIKLANRPFKDVKEMDNVLMENWNDTVGDDDVVYHLGDFSYKGAAHPEWYRLRLNGRHRFLQGNHDRPSWGDNYASFMHGQGKQAQKVVLFHYPIEEWDGWYRKSVHFHCHTHSHEFQTGVRRGNVTVEACEYKPIRLEEAIEKLATD